jgi:gluconolactonase
MTVVRYRGATRRLVLALMMLGAPGAVAQQSAGIPGVISPGVEPELVQEGFTFTEGPVGAPDGGLYFTDIRVNRIHRLDAVGKITTLYEQTNGANGLALNKAGELFAAEGGGKRISMRNRDGTPMVLTDNVEGKPFLAPNDLILDSKGGIYFTDPGPRPVVAGRPTCLCYLPAGAKQATVLDGTVGRPNGLILTADGKTLIVTDTIGNTVFAYDVQPDGTVKGKRAFAELRDIPAGKESGADGLAVDDRDRVYVTTRVGVQVFDAKGDYLGTIKLDRWPANVAFAGPDRQTLYMTAREGLYRVKMLSRGPDRPGK